MENSAKATLAEVVKERTKGKVAKSATTEMKVWNEVLIVENNI
jgi:hypothetical protein